MARSLNKVQLIGRLGGDPEMRVTGAGVQVTSFSVATNRQWTAKDGSQQEETDWHSVVAWDKLAQVCKDHLTKGRLVYVEGRLHTRTYESNGQKQYRTEIVALDMLMLDPAGSGEGQGGSREWQDEPMQAPRQRVAAPVATAGAASSSGGRGRQPVALPPDDDLDVEDMPF